ncbi:MAG TPA: ROK family protein [Acidimicrobiia bacterium]|nr:ROK family protein [Acidimicrobiia bacterium]
MTFHLGLDLGGTNIKVAVVSRDDEAIEVVSRESVETGAADGPDAVAANLVAVGSPVAKEYEAQTLGLGVPGHFDPEHGTIVLFPNLPGEWLGYPLRDRVAGALGMDTWMVNDARAFTLAEGILGAGKGHSTVACITLGTGVGGGLMIDGRLHRGAFGVAGELGHQTVLPDGPLCGCGNRGCVEALVRADVLASNAGKSTASEVFDGARNGDTRCVAAVAQMADFLGIGLANVVTMFGPDVIVVGGGIAEAGDLVLGPITRAVKSRVTLVPTERIEIVPASFGRFAGAVGAALAGVFRP